MTTLQQNYRNVCSDIARAAAEAGRPSESVRLVAVGKTFPAGDIREVYAAGQRDFGENYIREWYEKTEDLADLSDIVWHIIGDVQSNKTKFVAERAHWVHTIGRLKTAGFAKTSKASFCVAKTAGFAQTQQQPIL